MYSYLSNILSKLRREGVIVKWQYDSNNRNAFWGVSKWLNDDGSIKPQYYIDEEQIFKTGSTKLNLLLDI